MYIYIYIGELKLFLGVGKIIYTFTTIRFERVFGF